MFIPPISRCFIMGSRKNHCTWGPTPNPRLKDVAATCPTFFLLGPLNSKGPFKNSSAATMHFYLFWELHPTCLVWNNVNFFSVNVQQPTNLWVPKASEGMTGHIWLLGMCFWTSTNCVASGAHGNGRRSFQIDQAACEVLALDLIGTEREAVLWISMVDVHTPGRPLPLKIANSSKTRGSRSCAWWNAWRREVCADGDRVYLPNTAYML